MARGIQFIRQWSALRILESHRFPTYLEDLARDLEVSTRTVRRDLKVLETAGIFLDWEHDPDTGRTRVKLPQHVRVPQVAFTIGELLSLHFSSHLLRGLEGTPMKRGIDAAMRKIERAVPVDALEYAGHARRALVSKSGPLRNYRKHAHTIETVQKAVWGRRKLEIVYRAYGRAHTDHHVVHPYSLAFVEQSYYLIAFSELRGAMRHFLIDRVEKALLRREKATVPEDFDADEYLSRSFGIYREDRTFEVRVEFAAKIVAWVKEREWHPTQKLESLPDGRLLLSMTVDGLEDVMRWVLAFGSAARVLAPPELVERTHKELEAAAARYRGTDREA